MKFNNLEEFSTYITENNINLNDIVMTLKVSESHSESKESVVEENIPSNVCVKLSYLTDLDPINAKVCNENVLYVESFESIKGFCGAGRVNAFGREMVTNLCEMDGQTSLTLPIDIDNNFKYNATFKLRLLSEKKDDEPIMFIEEALLNESKNQI